MYLGFVTLGSAIVTRVLSRNGNTVTAADSAPTYRIYGPSGLMTNGTGTTSAGDQTGLYVLNHSSGAVSGDGYAANTTYTIYVTYAISGTTKGETYTFTVV